MAKTMTRTATEYVACKGTPDDVAAQLSALRHDGRMMYNAQGMPIMSALGIGQDGSVVVFVLCHEEVR